jgi:hypothetical protein
MKTPRVFKEAGLTRPGVNPKKTKLNLNKIITNRRTT